jgi:hypothetical protein
MQQFTLFTDINEEVKRLFQWVTPYIYGHVPVPPGDPVDPIESRQ